MNAQLWVCGRSLDESGKWAIQGVFDSMESAISACRDHTYFVGPIELNHPLPHENEEWPGSFYPEHEGRFEHGCG